MFDEIKNLVDFEQTEMNKQNKKLMIGTVVWGVIWAISFFAFLIFDLNKTVLWVWLLGLYFEHYRIKEANLSTYRTKLNAYMLNQISKRLPVKD